MRHDFFRQYVEAWRAGRDTSGFLDELNEGGYGLDTDNFL